jgi:hypothetical protein
VAFWVADADQTAARVEELGGSVLLAPMGISVGRFTIVADPQGAVFTATAVPGGPTHQRCRRVLTPDGGSLSRRLGVTCATRVNPAADVLEIRSRNPGVV